MPFSVCSGDRAYSPIFSVVPDVLDAASMDETHGAYVDDGINLGDDEHYTCSAETASDAATCAAATLSAANTVIGQWATDADVIENLQLAQGADAADAAEVAAPSENVTNLFPFAQENGKVRTQVLVVEPGRVREPGRLGEVFGEHRLRDRP